MSLNHHKQFNLLMTEQELVNSDSESLTQKCVIDISKTRALLAGNDPKINELPSDRLCQGDP